jgi:hypothetical protein
VRFDLGRIVRRADLTIASEVLDSLGELYCVVRNPPELAMFRPPKVVELLANPNRAPFGLSEEFATSPVHGTSESWMRFHP